MPRRSKEVRDTIKAALTLHRDGKIAVRCCHCGLDVVDHNDLIKLFKTQCRCVGCGKELRTDDVQLYPLLDVKACN